MTLTQYQLAEQLEQALGNPNQPDSLMSFQHTAELDEAEQFPHDEIAWLYQWGLQNYYIPTECGGKFTSFEEFVAFVRVLARRDLNISIAFTTLFWSFLTWMAGNEAQKEKLSRLMREDQVAMCLSYSERGHGSDLVGGSVIATKTEGGYVLNGEKWPINRATISGITFVLARTAVEGGNRGLSLFMVDKSELNPSQYYNLPKIKTHGIRAADMSGIGFSDCFIPTSTLIGREGEGLELALKGFQITRALCAAFSQGAADTSMRTTLNFAVNRRLYNKTVIDMPHARRTLTHAFTDMLICDCVNIGAARGFHVAPGQFSVWSAVDKYFVPVTLEQVMKDTSVVLGSRFYMRDEHDAGVFQKMLRDSAIISMFDGSSVVNLHALILQRRQLAKARVRRKPEKLEALKARLAQSFSLDQPVPTFDATKLELISRGADDVMQGLENTLAQLEALKVNTSDPTLDQAVLSQVLEFGQVILEELNAQDELITQSAFEHGHEQSFESFDLAKQYCRLHAAIACILMWMHNRQRNREALGDFFSRGEWLVLSLHRLLSHFRMALERPPEAYYENVAQELLRLHQEDKMFSIVPFQLAKSSTKEDISHATAPELQLH
ncbi:acyl-CoA dehydrogenase family protein [Leptolyngbya sp. BC1307]|uniref:acyl-CoA dehydrogenase family protein n=1 Tax=Leptolyngbya sp. BC1307 TaxID=2029589 RepID=UPI000EFBA1A5|nr:acyl-CoA dehydrogenase family protein [Leptolyngbya sp. BC1307]